MNSSPIHCMFCSEPFRVAMVSVSLADGHRPLLFEFCADDAEEALFKSVTPPHRGATRW
jgi:hypothetical protein